MKGRRTGPDRGQIDLQEPEGLGVDDVEVAASVHEDLGKPDVADDGIDNERVLPRARHAVGVVALVEATFTEQTSRRSCLRCRAEAFATYPP
jgi:hypothetical protein